ncbi:hypothetical protein SUGI_0186830 [Cryptomeria japonica]|nr:hypothetical protein SUGI_0186830 [Cryptomeria japonica]
MTVTIGKISSPPYFLVVQFQYQGGQTDILLELLLSPILAHAPHFIREAGPRPGMDVAQAGSSNWKYMKHNYGAVWSLE